MEIKTDIHPSIWDDVNSDSPMGLCEFDEWNKHSNNVKIIKKYRRKLPQLDYNNRFMYVTDILFQFNIKYLVNIRNFLIEKTKIDYPVIDIIIEYYGKEYYLIYANIVCETSFVDKWYRKIEQIFPFIIKLDENNKNIRVPDTEMAFYV